jgi:hypothetical protein
VIQGGELTLEPIDQIGDGASHGLVVESGIEGRLPPESEGCIDLGARLAGAVGGEEHVAGHRIDEADIDPCPRRLAFRPLEHLAITGRLSAELDNGAKNQGIYSDEASPDIGRRGARQEALGLELAQVGALEDDEFAGTGEFGRQHIGGLFADTIVLLVDEEAGSISRLVAEAADRNLPLQDTLGETLGWDSSSHHRRRRAAIIAALLSLLCAYRPD